MMSKNITVIPATRSTLSPVNREKDVLRVAAYCRVSTDHEEQEGSFQNQIEYYTTYINSADHFVLAGIYADEGISGTNAKRRSGFLQMIDDCRKGQIDLVITKSISRFARNTQDCLKYTRLLKNLGIDIFFEKENIHSLDSNGELLFTILSSLAQEESRNISENTTWGIRSNFQKGIPHINAKLLLGYEKNTNGQLVIQEEQASVVRRIFREYMNGYTPREISRHLNAEQINGVYDVPNWHPVTIERILKNEKYKGDLLMQKTYTPDYLTKRAAPNLGQFPQYYIKDNHPAIISKDQWAVVQAEIIRRQTFRQVHQVRELSNASENPLSSRCFCFKCGAKLLRKKSQQTGVYQWYCPGKKHLVSENGLHTKSTKPNCFKNPHGEIITDQKLISGFYRAWQHLLIHRELYMIKWQLLCEHEDLLQSFYAKRMIQVITSCISTHTFPDYQTMIRLTVEKMLVSGDGDCQVHFLERTVI